MLLLLLFWRFRFGGYARDRSSFLYDNLHRLCFFLLFFFFLAT